MHNYTMTFNGIREYILENEITDSFAIVLHPFDFDRIALDYISIHETIERPFEILGIEILEDTSGKVPKNQVMIIEL